MDQYSADSFRMLMLSSPLTNGENFALADKDVGDVARKLSMIWNMYDFFTMYAEVDGWEYDGDLKDPLDALSNPLDIWVISRLHELVAEVEERTEAYDLQGAIKPILPFIDDASNWYVRRSRRRFWKSEDDGDKNDAYRTLHYVLTRLAYVLAPFAPFMAEELYRKMTGDGESIHLKDWMSAGKVNSAVMQEMETLRAYVNQGLSLRAKAGLKVRQPLASVTVPTLGSTFEYEPILLDELNVKAVKEGAEVTLDETLTPALKREGMMREIVRHIQNARKNTGLNVDDRIVLVTHSGDEELLQAITEFADEIAHETLAVELVQSDRAQDLVVRVDGKELSIEVKKAVK
jgi:isoleucyl-tRNA synthetase